MIGYDVVRGGRIIASGSKRSVLTAERLSGLFDAPVAIDEEEGYFYARPEGAPGSGNVEK